MVRHVLFGVAFDADCDLALAEYVGDQPPRFSLQSDQGVFERDRSPVEIIEHGNWVSYARFENGEAVIRWRDLLSLWLSADGKNVKYSRHASCSDECFAAYVANFAISNVLTIQGEEVLHATVVRLNNRTIAFLGDSGAGKSTLTAYLLSKGGRIVTDDMLRLSEIDGDCIAEPGQPRIKLFRHDAQRLLPEAIELGQWNAYSEKYIFLTDDPTERGVRSPLDALIFLADPAAGNEDEIDMKRIKGASAFELLTASTMNRSFRTAERLRTQMQFAARVAAQIPIFSLTYKRDYDLLPAVADYIETTLAAELP